MNWKINGARARKGIPPAGTVTQSVSLTSPMECIRACQDGLIMSDCASVNYFNPFEYLNPEDNCELVASHAESLLSVPGMAYYEIVGGKPGRLQPCDVSHINKIKVYTIDRSG